MTAPLPELALEPWEPTRDTLHLWLQVVGKVQLQTVSPLNHWWHVSFSVAPRGLRSRRQERAGVVFEVELDLLAGALVVRAGDGRDAGFALHDGLSVAEFDERFHAALAELGVDVELPERPYRTPVSDVPFRDDVTHAAYDAEAVRRLHEVLIFSDSVLAEFAGRSVAKTSPVQVFWHSFDLAVTRFSGARAPLPDDVDPVTREAYSHEVISFGFWPGDKSVRFPAYYSYTAPEPAGLTEQPLRPAPAAAWRGGPSGSMAVLPYEDVRTAADARATLLDFLESAYDAGTRAAGWDRAALDRP